MPVPPLKPSNWARIQLLIQELRELLRDAVDARCAELPGHGADATLTELHRLKRKVRKTLNLLDAEELYSTIDRRIDAAAADVVSLALAEQPAERLKDVAASFKTYRAQRLVRAHVDREKRRQIAEIIRHRRLTWDTTLESESHFGQGLDERVVELPLAFDLADFGAPGRVLDAGSALNHAFVRDLIDPPVPDLVHFTQSGEHEEGRFAGGSVSYVFGDLRSLPFRDSYFDRILCISTLEHVGMDNSRYGASVERQLDASTFAVTELLRVLVPGGVLLITVPFGAPADHGWFRVFGPEDVDGVISAATCATAAVRYYRFDGSWHSTDRATCLEPANVRRSAAVYALAAIRLTKN